MPRPKRNEFSGAIYHIIARGNEQKEIFRDNNDYKMFLKLLGEAQKRFYWIIYAYCLMPNHYHLIIKIKESNLSQSMKWFHTKYVLKFNHKYKRCGHLFQGRFKSHLITDGYYQKRLLCYIHLNPVRPRNKNEIIPIESWNFLDKFPWSSHKVYLNKQAKPDWLCLDMLKEWEDSADLARQKYENMMRSCFGKMGSDPRLRRGSDPAEENNVCDKVSRANPAEENIH